MFGFKKYEKRDRDQLIRESIMSDEFLDFMKKNNEPYETLLTYYRCAIMEIETKFNVLNEQFSIQYDRNPIETIKSRLKSRDSLIRKIRNRGIPLTLEAIEENITDVAGVRVICSFPEDIYMLADCFLQQDDVTLIQRKDYIQNPKSGGYRSLHLIVEVPIFLQDEKRAMKVEVQLRTIAMDFWASLEHKLRYKKSIPPELAEALAKELVECAEISAALDTRMQTIRNKIMNGQEQTPPPHKSVLPQKPLKTILSPASPLDIVTKAFPANGTSDSQKVSTIQPSADEDSHFAAAAAGFSDPSASSVYSVKFGNAADFGDTEAEYDSDDEDSETFPPENHRRSSF